jgi:Holliday junction resolvase RusA-like endonuclease
VTRVEFTVPGEPATKGSYKAFPGRNGKMVVKNDNPRCKGWQDAIATVARFAMQGRKPLTCAVTVRAAFRCRWEGKGEPSGVPFVDLDKLQRALFDGLQGVVLDDDALVVDVHATKTWGEPGVTVTVEPVR